jgi:hypothetical protein
MEQNPSWETNGSSTSQEIPCILRNPLIPCRVHNISPIFYSLNQISTCYAFSPYLKPILLVMLS